MVMMRWKGKWVASLCAAMMLSLTTAWAGPTAKQIRHATADYLKQGNPDEGIDKLSGYMSLRVSNTSRVPTREMEVLEAAAECIQFLELSKKYEMPASFQEWILESGKRLHLFVEVLQPEDELLSVVGILDSLRSRDAAGTAEYFDLALAIAVVMDKPVQKMHFQMGRNVLAYVPDPVERFNYFKTLYSSGRSKMDYENLTVQELIFVVHVPVPMQELQWATEHVDGRLNDWGENYSRIQYDHARLDTSRFQWDQGTYTLASISSLGGICVDQAYFCVITARANGIPSIYFRGAGNSCNHAWFAFMEKPGEWHLGIGRYGSEYTTGFAIDPQTNRQMTDHDVEYTCERSLHSADLLRASANMSIADVLFNRDPDGALKCAKEARSLVKRYLPAWQAERRLLIKQEQYDELLRQFEEQKDIFRKYPYILNDSAAEISSALKSAGREDEAGEVLRKLAGAVGDDQDDITYGLEIRKIELLISAGDIKKARREMEQLLEDPAYRGNKSFGLIQKYISMTSKSDQTQAAVKFLEDYIPELTGSFRFPSSYEARLWEMMQTAYKNNNDLKEAEEMTDRINRLQAN
jgi:hypothetical protein